MRRAADEPGRPESGARLLFFAISSAINPPFRRPAKGLPWRRNVPRPILSLSSYLDLLEIAWGSYQVAVGPIARNQYFRYVLYHTPMISLARKAHRTLLESECEDVTDDDVARSFDRLVEPSLVFNREMANVYSGSLDVSVTGLLASVPVLLGASANRVVLVWHSGLALNSSAESSGTMHIARSRHNALVSISAPDVWSMSTCMTHWPSI